MFKDGQHTVWFRTSRGQGTGIVYLADGKISGGDSFFNYSGSYQIDGDRFTAVLTTKRFADGPTPTVFGLDEVEVKVTGTFKGTIACCTGSSDQAPGIDFEATLFLGQDQADRQADRQTEPQAELLEAPRLVPPLNVAKLPKSGNERYRPRNPLVPGSTR
jgi:hypothetical protein